jgi:hypothetical protein
MMTTVETAANLPNPFDNLPADDLAERLPELEWIMDGIKNGAHLLLRGDAGMGKTTLIDRATHGLAEQGAGHLFKVDATQPPSQIVQQLEQWAHQLKNGLSAVLPSGAAEGNIPLLSPGLNGPEQVLPTLKLLDQIAAKSGAALGVCFDNFKSDSSRGPHPLMTDLNAALSQLRHLGLIVATDEKVSPFNSPVERRELGPIEPTNLAKTINRQFAGLKNVAADLGQVCVELGGPNTAEIIHLAGKTFDAAKQAGRATVDLVHHAFEENLREYAPAFARIWTNLSTAERALLGKVAKAVEQFTTPENLTKLADTSFAAVSLMQKGLLGQLPNGVLYLVSSAFRDWSAQMSLHLDASATLPVAGPKALQFNFGVNATASHVANVHP